MTTENTHNQIPFKFDFPENYDVNEEAKKVQLHQKHRGLRYAFNPSKHGGSNDSILFEYDDETGDSIFQIEKRTNKDKLITACEPTLVQMTRFLEVCKIRFPGYIEYAHLREAVRGRLKTYARSLLTQTSDLIEEESEAGMLIEETMRVYDQIENL